MKNLRKSKLLECIKKWSKENHKPIFRAIEIPCLQKSKSFLSKHRVDNPKGYTEYFVRTGKGKYKLKN